MKKKLNGFLIKSNIYIITFVILACYCLFIDYLTFLFDIKYFVSLTIGTIVLIFLFFLLRKNVEIKKCFEKADIFFFIFLLLLLAVTIVYPDRNFDTLNYHLYVQENPFSDKIFYDFFAGRNINSFSYPLADRMMYFFRYFLGYRLGVIFNYFILVVIYYQVKEILSYYAKIKHKLMESIVASLIVFSLSIIELVDSYYIDLFSIVPLLGIFIIAFVKNEKLEQKMLLLCLLSGIAVAFKITNLIYVVIFAILFIISNIKSLLKINFKYYVYSILLIMLPIMPYLLYTYISTGNPVFPFYNSIFKSEYFPIINWIDTKFGPKSFQELIVWPLKMIFVPFRAVDYGIVEPMWGFPYIFSFMYIIICFTKFILKKKYDKKLFLTSILIFSLYLIWSKFLMGYTRYSLFLLIFSSIYFYVIFIKTIHKKQYFLTSLFLLLISINLFYSLNNFGDKNQDWIYNNLLNSTKEDYIYNYKRLLLKDSKISLPNSSAFLVANNNSGYSLLLNDDVPVISVAVGMPTKQTEAIFEKMLKKYSNYYTFSDMYFFESTLDTLNNLDYFITEIKRIDSNITNSYNSIFLYKIVKSKVENNYKSLQNEDVLLEKSESKHVTFWIGLDKHIKNISKDLKYNLYYEKNGKKIILYHDIIKSNGDLTKVNLNVEKNENKQIKIELVDNINNISLMVMNLIYE